MHETCFSVIIFNFGEMLNRKHSYDLFRLKRSNCPKKWVASSIWGRTYYLLINRKVHKSKRPCKSLMPTIVLKKYMTILSILFKNSIMTKSYGFYSKSRWNIIQYSREWSWSIVTGHIILNHVPSRLREWFWILMSK